MSAAKHSGVGVSGFAPSLGELALNQLRECALALESGIADGPILPKVRLEEIRAHLAARFDFTRPLPLEDVVADVERMMRAWQVQVTHPRYFGLFNPSVTLASIVGDLLAAMYNPQLATWSTSPAANEMERHALAWLTAKFGLPPETFATFTSGGAEANLSATIVALTKTFPDYGDCGLRGLSASPTIYLTAETHNSFNKIAHIMGLGRNAIRVIATGADLKIDLEHLARRIAEDRKNGFAPFMVVGTAGTTAAGAIDPLAELAAFCQRENLWFHVDAAWGGSAVISPALKPYLAGIELADSITCDAHKWLSVPMGAGMSFCRHPEAAAQAYRVDTVVMPGKTEGAVDPYTTTMQWSRRFIGLKLFMALATYGESGYIEMIEHQTRMGNMLRALLGCSGWKIVNSTPLPLVCFTRNGIDVTKFLAAVLERNIAWMSTVKLSNGVHALRACVTSFRTTERDVEEVVAALDRLAS
ncbi:MAG TPA: pyridoxal-dependent decarboxylase [Bryobacteraceae bacterium]|nr:pyridoxal-dependent decarboxylase [Bryobacteraceae bacterium]